MRKWSPFGKRRSSRTATATSTQVRRNAFTTLLGGSLATKAQAPASWSVGDRVLDLYEVTDVHREGGMGVVYRVRHLAWNTDLAVKSEDEF